MVNPMGRSNPWLAREIGRRIDLAWRMAGFASRAAMVRAAGPGLDYNQVAVWARGDALPRIDGLIAIAEACAVSLDWLAMGTEAKPTAFAEWLEGPVGAHAPPEARRFLSSLPLHGYKIGGAFYDLAFQAWKLGLDRRTAARAARDTERELGQ